MKRDILGPRMSSSTLEEGLKDDGASAEAILDKLAKKVFEEGEQAGALVKAVMEAGEEAPPRPERRPRVYFFDLPEMRPALELLDGWAMIEHGMALGDVGKYRPPASAGRVSTWAHRAVEQHAQVSQVLERMGDPILLKNLLRWRYPRSFGAVHAGIQSRGWEHRNTIESFTSRTLLEVQRLLGAHEGDMWVLLRETEKEFIRRL